jgi:uncharacterized protein YraI
MYTSSIALSLTAIVSIVNGYPIKADSVNCRSGPGTNFPVVKSYNLNDDVTLSCQAPGTNINGDELWDKTSDGCYVADWYV